MIQKKDWPEILTQFYLTCLTEKIVEIKYIKVLLKINGQTWRHLVCFASRNFVFNSLGFFEQNENSSVIQYLKRHISRCSWNLTISQEMCRIFLIHYFLLSCPVLRNHILYYHMFFYYIFKTLTRFPIEEIYFICFMQEVKFFKTKPVIWWKLLELYQCLMQSSSKEGGQRATWCGKFLAYCHRDVC